MLMFQTSPSTPDLGPVVDMTVTPAGSKYKSGTCDVTVSFPATSATSATYSYKVVVTPGRVDAGSSFQISMFYFNSHLREDIRHLVIHERNLFK